MSGPVTIWEQTAEAFEQKLTAVADDQWELATPCDQWTVKDLVDHAVGVQAMVGSLVGASVDAEQGWPAVRSALTAALADPANLEGEAPPQAGPFAGMPKHQVLGIAVGDLLIHAWDLARAVGGDEELPPAAVEAVQMGFSRMPEPMLRSSGMFGAAVEVGDDASPQDKLLAFAGRQP